jgi:signal transduction histidine kinase
MVEAIVSELKAMDHLIHDLLSFGRKTPLNKGGVSAEPLLRKLVPQIIEGLDGIRPRVKMEFSDPPPVILGDEILLRQAFLNLIQNACDAMPGGGELTIEGRLLVLEKKATVLIQIEDTGIGIAKEHIEKIFVPFFTRKEKGTGLGLAIVHKIILSHGGRIRVESEPGKGTLFQIYLPSASF